MKTISFYSYKGGVGRTMLTAQVARLLAALGKKVVVADFDFDAPGIPAVFGKRFADVKEGGLFELVTKFKEGVSKESDEKYIDFKKCLSDCLLDVKIELTGDNSAKQGCIQILPSGCINENYWNKIADPEWSGLLAKSGLRPNSFRHLVKQALIPALTEMQFDYLLIDTRAGITYYGSIARQVSDRQAMIFCPNDEAKDALESFLLPQVIKLQEKYPLDKLVFVVSRMPPELFKQKEEVFDGMVNLIANKLKGQSQLLERTKFFKLHSDLLTHLNPKERNLDKRFLDIKKEKVDIVQIHKDILMVLAALCPEEVPDIANGKPPVEKALALWTKIFQYPFKITYENRLFGFLESGEIQNPDDEKRNVAFKVETFLEFLNNFFESLKDSGCPNPEATMNKALTNAGFECGKAFGSALISKWNEDKNSDTETPTQKIKKWCEFDTRAGFGEMTYDENKGTLEVKNLFIVDTNITGERDYSAFFTGYVKGVLDQLVGEGYSNVTKIKITDVVKSIVI